MELPSEIIDTEEIDRLAVGHACAVSIIDTRKHEIYTSNNNSICKELNPGPGFAPDCDRYCGQAFSRAAEAPEEIIDYRCHAGLDCRAVVYPHGSRPLVAIIGRTFTDADKYREATGRAISGDWSNYPQNDFFDNVLMSGSARHLDQAALAMQKLAAKGRPQVPLEPEVSSEGDTVLRDPRRHDAAGGAPSVPQAEAGGPRHRTGGVGSWRSFFGSLPKLEYAEAADATLAFLAEQFGFKSLLWLTRDGSHLENLSSFGTLKGLRVRMGIRADDERLLRALNEGRPLEIDERRKGRQEKSERQMTLFPIGFGGGISAAIAVLDPIENESIIGQIVRISRAIAQPFEILRLRKEVERGDQISTAIRKFSQALKTSESDDLWISLTQNAAEMLKAERSSILVFDEDSQRFQIKAMLGGADTFRDDPTIGERVARYVYGTKQAIAVEDIAKTGVPAGTGGRTYKTPSFLSSPIAVGGRVIGVMNFADRGCGEPFDKDSLELFDAIAPQLAMAIDRAELKERAGQFEQLSVTDSLTGLLNRRYMEERLMEETKRSNRHGYPMSFMMVDVDEFKSYNDNFGHPAGDVALKTVGNVIRDTLRSADVAARFGGEEFAILLPQTTSKEARMIADRIRSNIEQTQFPHRQVTISIGVSSCSAELCQDADLVSTADKALYQAKRSGRNRVLAFEEKPDKVPA